MDVVICKPGKGVTVMTFPEGRRVDVPCPFEWPCAPCSDGKRLAFCCAQCRDCLCMESFTLQPVCRMPAVAGVCELRFSTCGSFLFQLGSEGDCIHTRCIETGDLLYAAPVGVFPRCMRQDASGERILCAGGALNEITLLSAPDLTLLHKNETHQPCFYADFCQNGLVLVCAVECGDIQSEVCTLSADGEKLRKIVRFSGPPCALCVCDEGTSALVSTGAGLSKIGLLNGKVLWTQPQWSLCTRVECRGKWALVSGTTDGGVWLLEHARPYRQYLLDSAADSQACFA